ncbi:crotonase/enoyl-CoA hydratase family protein [Roseobacter sp. N2S]|uniref:crotonase/enoyl-CoA hydratase family protein n=1 Tax=Roseobacter sp. N2S TaxID=2663844 RepID=UPI0028663BB4|nr:crotonase/enoyl-CoA hydratase family protein [Roseobacter sp. N2S]MDR6264820.1 enoyl-CoA hydratase/carnithine racemase [Roseobacter sp. N2S]
MYERLTIEIKDHVAEVMLNRPEKKNALDTQFFDELAAAGESLKGNKDVRAVVIYGAGGCFCAGIDTSALMEFAATIDQVRAMLATPPENGRGNRFQRPTVVWQELQVPVIAAIEGVAFGGGIQLALAADFRFMAPSAKMSIMEAKWGIIPDMGITQSLPQLMRADQAKELIMTGRVVEADEALSLGLTTWISDDPITAARAMAANLAARSPEAVQGSKALVDQVWPAGSEGLALEGKLQSKIIGYPNQMETVTAQMQKRAPVYK